MSAGGSLAEVLPPEALTAAEPGAAMAALTAEAEAVVRPHSTEEVAETLRWAEAHQVGVLTLGSGERVRRRPREGRFIALVTDRMSGLEIYEPADVTLTARAGTPLREVADALAEHGQWLPFDPPHVLRRTLGGLVAYGESGPAGTGYGQLRNHVLGATVVCGDGRVLRLGGRVVKNVAGFDLLRPVVGSRGRLGVITSVCLRAFPVPAEDRVLLLRSDGLAGLGEVARSVRTAPVLPVSVAAYTTSDAPRGGAVLVVRLHGAARTVSADQATLERHAGVTFEEPTDPSGLRSALRDQATDGAVVVRVGLLPSRLFEGLEAARECLGEATVAADAYAGTARLAASGVDRDGVRRLREAVEGLGGTLAVQAADPAWDDEGLASRPRPEERELAARLEQVFDPSGVFWPCQA